MSAARLAVDRRYRVNRPQYNLYIRCRDGAMCLIEKRTGEHIAIEATMQAKYGGMFIRPEGRYGVFLMDDEIHQVEELPQ